MHGAAANRPGMGYPSQAERMLGMAGVNLGLSGNGLMQPYVPGRQCDESPPSITVFVIVFSHTASYTYRCAGTTQRQDCCLRSTPRLWWSTVRCVTFYCSALIIIYHHEHHAALYSLTPARNLLHAFLCTAAHDPPVILTPPSTVVTDSTTWITSCHWRSTTAP